MPLHVERVFRLFREEAIRVTERNRNMDPIAYQIRFNYGGSLFIQPHRITYEGVPDDGHATHKRTAPLIKSALILIRKAAPQVPR
jgi:hypothetical protein